MNIVFEFEVVTDDLLCQVTKILGVFPDYDTAREFYESQLVKRGLDPGKVLQKKVGDKGLYFMPEGCEFTLVINLNWIKELTDKVNEMEMRE